MTWLRLWHQTGHIYVGSDEEFSKIEFLIAPNNLYEGNLFLKSDMPIKTKKWEKLLGFEAILWCQTILLCLKSMLYGRFEFDSNMSWPPWLQNDHIKVNHLKFLVWGESWKSFFSPTFIDLHLRSRSPTLVLSCRYFSRGSHRLPVKRPSPPHHPISPSGSFPCSLYQEPIAALDLSSAIRGRSLTTSRDPPGPHPLSSTKPGRIRNSDQNWRNKTTRGSSAPRLHPGQQRQQAPASFSPLSLPLSRRPAMAAAAPSSLSLLPSSSSSSSRRNAVGVSPARAGLALKSPLRRLGFAGAAADPCLALNVASRVREVAGPAGRGPRGVVSMAKKSVGDLTGADLKGKKVFVRADLNVPLDESRNITDDTRIRAAIPTIKYLVDNGAKVILSSHLVSKVNPDYLLSLYLYHIYRCIYARRKIIWVLRRFACAVLLFLVSWKFFFIVQSSIFSPSRWNTRFPDYYFNLSASLIPFLLGLGIVNALNAVAEFANYFGMYFPLNSAIIGMKVQMIIGQVVQSYHGMSFRMILRLLNRCRT